MQTHLMATGKSPDRAAMAAGSRIGSTASPFRTIASWFLNCLRVTSIRPAASRTDTLPSGGAMHLRARLLGHWRVVRAADATITRISAAVPETEAAVTGRFHREQFDLPNSDIVSQRT